MREDEWEGHVARMGAIQDFNLKTPREGAAL